ncbi:MATE family efflux transporter [Halosquirtibacter laminarini]|uniref:MATE family efflux transporter n=1 Tax=Halosquirtibacter laminarini TaxID=3374600 RepID=A0AC61NR76_9BACT|nr:MATE family efflux transporter [Prolixibacteraceae bacterium]
MQDLTKGNESRLLLTFVWPLILANIFQNLYNVVDSAIVGNFIGKQALASVGASFPIIYTLISLIIGVGSGASIVVSQYFGAKDNEKVKRTIDTVFIFFLGASFLITLIGIPLAPSIFRLMDLPAELQDSAVDYIQIYLSGIFVFFSFSGISSILRGLGDSKTPLKYMVFSTILNVVLDILFIVVFGWGIKGVAFATILSQAFALIGAIVHLNRTHDIIRLTFRRYHFDVTIFKEAVRIGLPTGLQQAFVAIGMMIMMRLVNGFGTNTVAAYAAAMRIDAFVKMPALTFASGLSSFVGQNLGAKLEGRARKGLKSTVFVSGAYCLIVAILIYLFGENVMSWFTKDPEVISIGYNYLWICSLMYWAFSLMFSFIGFLRGAGATLVPMYITLINLWIIRIPLAIFLSKSYGIMGLWSSFPISWVLGALGAGGYFFSNRWRGKIAK